MVFQSYALYPHMTVRANMEFGMKVAGVPAEERQRRVMEAARILQLEDYLTRKPAQLSGGQRQRVAIGRAIVKQPDVFLFDEPLSNLDAKLRIQMRVELEGLHRQLGATMIYVTHDQVEAMTMADKIVVLNQGRVEQVGAPMELYHHPKTIFVAGFIGAPSMNCLTSADLQGADNLHLHPETATLGIRPEHLELTATGNGMIAAEVAVKEQLGGESYLYLNTASGGKLVAKTDGDDQTAMGDAIGVNLPENRIHQFNAAGDAIPVR
jgi:ABC-type sugar transport system ATPase subunit